MTDLVCKEPGLQHLYPHHLPPSSHPYQEALAPCPEATGGGGSLRVGTWQSERGPTCPVRGPDIPQSPRAWLQQGGFLVTGVTGGVRMTAKVVRLCLVPARTCLSAS